MPSDGRDVGRNWNSSGTPNEQLIRKTVKMGLTYRKDNFIISTKLTVNLKYCSNGVGVMAW